MAGPHPESQLRFTASEVPETKREHAKQRLLNEEDPEKNTLPDETVPPALRQFLFSLRPSLRPVSLSESWTRDCRDLKEDT